MKTLTITACTYRRPEGLKALFKSIESLQLPEDIKTEIRIIDNAPTPEAKALVEELGKSAPCLVHYAHEAEAGIAPARNRGLREAKDSDFLAFIDDDETLDENWLIELWASQKKHAAHFVQGPVMMTVADQVDQWWLETLLFKQKIFPDGTPRHEAWSNNVLIDMAFVKEHSIEFDPALKFDGGEDTLFFQTMTSKGAKGVFAANAIVYEEQPKDRLTWNWAIKRQFRNGNTRAMIAYKTKPFAKAVLSSVIRAGGCFIFGIAHVPSIIVKGKVGFANAITYFARCFGILYGMFGKTFLEYNRG